MAESEPIHARLIGALFVERGLVSESQIRVALELQRETGQQLGQILVERFGVSRKELASVVAEQWAKLGGTSGPEDTASWRRLGEIFVERGFVSEDELEQALTRQRQTGERLGEALVAQGVISKFELAGALAEQMATLEAPAADDATAEQAEATVHHLPTRAPEPDEVPFGTVVDLEIEPAAEPRTEPEVGAEDAAADTEVAVVAELAEDVGAAEVEFEPEAAPEPEWRPEPEPEPERQAEAEIGPERVEAIAIDDVGHVSLVPPALEHEHVHIERVQVEHGEVEHGEIEHVEHEHVGPEEGERERAELFDDLRSAIVAETFPVDEPGAEAVASVACLAFAPTTDGYRLVALEILPEPGETITVPDVGERLVLRLGRSPLPGDRRLCAYVEELVTPAPVAVLAY